jgi:hypothetical protein
MSSRLMFVSKAGAYQSDPHSHIVLVIRLALPTNIIPGRKGLPGAKALTFLPCGLYYKSLTIVIYYCSIVIYY